MMSAMWVVRSTETTASLAVVAFLQFSIEINAMHQFDWTQTIMCPGHVVWAHCRSKVILPLTGYNNYVEFRFERDFSRGIDFFQFSFCSELLASNVL